MIKIRNVLLLGLVAVAFVLAGCPHRHHHHRHYPHVPHPHVPHPPHP